jgi:excisionase family DNA binding protein
LTQATQLAQLLCEHDFVTEGYVSTGEAARALGVSRATIGRWARAGKITPANRTIGGGHYRWDLDKLQAVMAQASEVAKRDEQP